MLNITDITGRVIQYTGNGVIPAAILLVIGAYLYLQKKKLT